MSEREDLLNNLKIDRSQAPISDQPVYRKSILLGAAVAIVLVFSWIFLSEDELKRKMNDFSKILDKAKELEKKMKESQQNLKKISVVGTSGTESVKVTLNGDGEIQSLFISDKLFKEDKSLIEDLIIAAHNNAKISLKNRTSEEISKATSELGIPGFKWPF